MPPLNEPYDRLLAPLFDALSLEDAMGVLVGPRPADSTAYQAAQELVRQPQIANRHDLVAAVWLYVDDLDRSHRASQRDGSSTGSYWHGIMHRREGDFGNSGYWFSRAGEHPAIEAVRQSPESKALGGYDPHRFVDMVEQAGGEDSPELVALQRAEWMALLSWCVTHNKR